MIKNLSTASKSHQMKMSFVIAITCLAALSVFVGWIKLQQNNDDLSIAVTDTDDTYSLTAKFNAEYTSRVQDYINHTIRPDNSFRSANDDVDVIATLKDKTEFHIKGSPGKLELDFDKRKNSYSSYQRFKQLCGGVSNLLKKQ